MYVSPCGSRQLVSLTGRQESGRPLESLPKKRGWVVGSSKPKLYPLVSSGY